MSAESPSPSRRRRKSRQSSGSNLSASTGSVRPPRSSSDSSTDGPKGTFASKQAMLEKVYKEADSIASPGKSPPALAGTLRTHSGPAATTRDTSQSPKRKGRSTRFGTMKKFLKRSSTGYKEGVSDVGRTAAGQNEEREQRLLAKTHFARAATVLYPLPKATKTSSSGKKFVDLGEERVVSFLAKCKEKAENASGGLGITPSIVNELQLLIQQFPTVPVAMFSPLLTQHDGNLYAVQCYLTDRGWPTAVEEHAKSQSLSMSLDSSALLAGRGAGTEPEFSDERDPHFSTLYYCGRVKDIRKVLKLILYAPPGAYCTFFTQSGRSYQYQALYKLPQDVYEDFSRIKSMYLKEPASNMALDSGAVVHESIVSPKVYGGWKIGRRLDKPVRNPQLLTAANDVPLLLDKIRATAKRKELQTLSS